MTTRTLLRSMLSTQPIYRGDLNFSKFKNRKIGRDPKIFSSNSLHIGGNIEIFPSPKGCNTLGREMAIRLFTDFQIRAEEFSEFKSHSLYNGRNIEVSSSSKDCNVINDQKIVTSTMKERGRGVQ